MSTWPPLDIRLDRDGGCDDDRLVDSSLPARMSGIENLYSAASSSSAASARRWVTVGPAGLMDVLMSWRIRLLFQHKNISMAASMMVSTASDTMMAMIVVMGRPDGATTVVDLPVSSTVTVWSSLIAVEELLLVSISPVLNPLRTSY